MPRNGSGTYSLPAGNPVVTNTDITVSWGNGTMNDIATAITGSIARDGQSPPTANLPMGGFKLTGLAAGSNNGDSVRYEQVLLLAGGTVTGNVIFSGAVVDSAVAVSGTNTYTATLAGLVLTDGYIVTVDFANANTTAAATINFNGGGAVDIRGGNGASGINCAIGTLTGVQRLRYNSANTCFIALDVKAYDLSSYSGANYQLRVGEAAKYEFSAVASVALKLAAAAGQEYEIRPSIFTSTVATADLRINNSSASTFVEAIISYHSGGASGPGAVYGQQETIDDKDLNIGGYFANGLTATLFCLPSETATKMFNPNYNDGSAYALLGGRNVQSRTIEEMTSILVRTGTMSGRVSITRIA